MDELMIDLFTKYPVLGTVLTLVLAGHKLASAVVALTPTPKDNTAYGKFYKVVEWFSLTVGKAKDKA